jgi:hypothetical protein
VLELGEVPDCNRDAARVKSFKNRDAIGMIHGGRIDQARPLFVARHRIECGGRVALDDLAQGVAHRLEEMIAGGQPGAGGGEPDEIPPHAGGVGGVHELKGHIDRRIGEPVVAGHPEHRQAGTEMMIG